MSRAVQVRVTGRVQGVFYRRYAAEEAARLGVAGWVSNERDASVLVHAEGEDDAVDAMVAWCREGSPASAVDQLDVEEVDPAGSSGFDVR